MLRDRRLTDWVWLFFVVLAGVKYTFHLGDIDDLPVFSAEAAFLQRGIDLLQRGIFDPADSPLYSVWYYVLSLFTADAIRLYILNHALLIVGTTALTYLLLRALKTSPALAALGSIAYLVSSALFAPPFNGLFALFVMLVFLNWAMRCASEQNAYVVAAAGALLMTFARAEYLASLVLFVVWLVIHDMRKGRPRLPVGRIARIGGILLLTAVAVGVIGNPLGTHKSSMAFCVSYFQQVAVTHGVAVSGATVLQFPFDCGIVQQATFGAAQSIPALFTSNPAAYAGFILHNVGTYLAASSLIPFVAPFVFLAPMFQTLLAYVELALLIGAVVVIGKAAAADGLPSLKAPLPARFLVSAGIIGVANVLAAVLYYPRFYYLLPQTALLVCGLFALLSSTLKVPIVHTRSLRAAVASGLLMVIIVPNHVHGWLPPISTEAVEPGGMWAATNEKGSDPALQNRILGRRFEWAMPGWPALAQYWSAQEFSLGAHPLQQYRPQRVLANRITVESIRELPIKSRVNILGIGNYAAFLPDNYRYAAYWTTRQKALRTFMDDQKVNMVVVNHLFELFYKSDPYYAALMRNPESLGFVRRDIPGSAESLLLERSLVREMDVAEQEIEIR